MMTLILLFACGGVTTTADSEGDTGTSDSALPALGLGALSGDCGVLDDEWGSTDPFTLRNAVALTGWDEALLSDEGRTVWEAGNLGGSSLESEVLAFEVLRFCEGADLVKTESEIVYDDDGGKKTDLLVTIDGVEVGVSVTRAFHYPPGEPYTSAEALALLEGKLEDVTASAENAADGDDWDRSMLHVVAYDGQHADEIDTAWAGIGGAVKDGHGLIVTVTDGDDAAIY